jgi:endonuclease III
MTKSANETINRAKRPFNIGIVVRKLKQQTELEKAPIVTYVAQLTKDPYRILISCILSLRTKDQTTTQATIRLFNEAHTPQQMVTLSKERIAQLIYPVGFYNTKAKTILEISRILKEAYGGNVPQELDALLSFPGVGRKTANLVITEAFGKYGICVDTHVHRIMNRFGYVRTATPEEAEFALRKKLPRKYWIEINTLLVKFGQIVCVPVSPFCTRCTIIQYCRRAGVRTYR